MSELLKMLEAGAGGEGTLSVFPHEETPVPLSEIWQDSARAGAWLVGQVGAAGVVGAILVSSRNCIATLLGAWRAGLTVASLPYPARFATPERTAEEYRRQVDDLCALVGADVVLADPEYLPFLEDLRVRAVAFDACLSGRVQANPSGEQGHFVQFTSGTTSTPKGVRLSLDGVAANVHSLLDAVQPVRRDVVCSWLPLSHDMGLIGLFLTAWAGNAPGCAGQIDIRLIRTEEFRRRPWLWLETCSRCSATITAAPNYGFELAMQHLDRSRGANLGSVRLCVTGGELLRGGTLRRFSEMTSGLGLNSVALSPAYGMAEATVAVTMVRPAEHWRSVRLSPDAVDAGTTVAAREGDGLEVVSTGTPVPRMQIRIDDGAQERMGRIEVAGPSLFEGYQGHGESGLPNQGWFRTGDLGFVRAGELFPVGRTDDMLKVMGRIHSAGAIEATAGEHPAVHRGSCAVVAGEGGPVLIAERGRKTQLASLDEAARWIRDAVADRCGADIAAVVFVESSTLLRTPSGKLQRHRIKSDYEAGRLAQESARDFGRSA